MQFLEHEDFSNVPPILILQAAEKMGLDDNNAYLKVIIGSKLPNLQMSM
jgi:hypothetical protein